MNFLFHSTQKENPKSQDLKFSINKFYFVFVLLFSVIAVPVAAYTENIDGLYTIYTWDWSSSESSVRSDAGAYTPSMKISAGLFGANKRQNGGVSTAGLTQYNYEDVSAAGQTKINFSVAGPLTLVNNVGVEIPVVWFKTATTRQSFSTQSDFSFRVSLNTIDGRLTSDSEYYISQSRVTLYNGEVAVYVLQPTVISSEEIFSTTLETVSSNRLIHYDILFSLDVSDSDTDIVFDRIALDFPCCVALYMPYNSSSSSYYSRYVISVSKPELVIAPTQSMIDDLFVGQNVNNDLITKLGTINTVDQARINAQNSSYSEVSTVTGSLSGMTDFSESLASQVDLSQEVDVLSDGALIDSVNNMWDLFPWDSPFMTTAIGMVGSIALLSLVLHGGERALFGKSSVGRKSSKKGDDS